MSNEIDSQKDSCVFVCLKILTSLKSSTSNVPEYIARELKTFIEQEKTSQSYPISTDHIFYTENSIKHHYHPVNILKNLAIPQVLFYDDNSQKYSSFNQNCLQNSNKIFIKSINVSLKKTIPALLNAFRSENCLKAIIYQTELGAYAIAIKEGLFWKSSEYKSSSISDINIKGYSALLKYFQDSLSSPKVLIYI